MKNPEPMYVSANDRKCKNVASKRHLKDMISLWIYHPNPLNQQSMNVLPNDLSKDLYICRERASNRLQETPQQRL